MTSSIRPPASQHISQQNNAFHYAAIVRNETAWHLPYLPEFENNED